MNGTLKQLTVVSGKGGTGKTTVLACFAALADNDVVADCDVDAANLHLVLTPTIIESGDFYGAKIVIRDEALCTECGECERRCRFNAITTTEVDELACEGCGMCVVACPSGALHLESVSCGKWYLSETDYGPLAHAKLAPAAESSGRLVTMVRQKAEDTAIQRGIPMVLIDGAPGIGCTAAAALTDTDLALIVTEPTLSGIHDMERVCQLSAHFGIPMTVLINKADINAENTQRIRDYCAQQGITVVGELPYDETVTEAMAQAVPLVEYRDGPVGQGIRKAWEKLRRILGNQLGTRAGKEGNSMPLYEYECLECGETQEVLQRNSKEAPPKCRNCGADNTRRLVSAAAVHSSAGSSSSGASCPTGTCPF